MASTRGSASAVLALLVALTACGGSSAGPKSSADKHVCASIVTDAKQAFISSGSDLAAHNADAVERDLANGIATLKGDVSSLTATDPVHRAGEKAISAYQALLTAFQDNSPSEIEAATKALPGPVSALQDLCLGR